MPEPYWPKRKGSYTLADAARTGDRLARVACRYCKRVRWFRLDDLQTVLGNIECDDVAHMMKCAGCNKRQTLELRIESPSAADRQKMTLRRVERIYYIRRVVWRDEGPG